MDTSIDSGFRATDLTASRAHGKIADIEVLRGISVLFVVQSHVTSTLLPAPVAWLTHLETHYFNFWPGVDLFFAISGFVIARSLIPRLQTARGGTDYAVTVATFWIRRCWRLLPSAWLWLGVILVAAAIFNRSGRFGYFHDNFESAIAALLSVANVHFAMAFGHFGAGASAPYWSLSLEEQFYVALPIVVLAAGRRLGAVLAAILVVMFLLPEGSSLFYCCRIQPILLGVLLALFERMPTYRIVEPAWLGRGSMARSLFLIVPLLLLAALAPLGQQIVPYRLDVIAIITAWLVFVASYDRNYTIGAGVGQRALMWFGSRSYAIYLVHTPMFCATYEVFYRLYAPGTVFDERFDKWFLLVGLAGTVVLAEMNYRFVEQPLRRRGNRIARRFQAAHRQTAIAADTHRDWPAKMDI